MIKVGRVEWIRPPRQGHYATLNNNTRKYKSRPCTQYIIYAVGCRRLTRVIAAITAVGCAAFSVLPLTRSRSLRPLLRRYHGPKEKYNKLKFRRPTRWVDILPSDLDVLENDRVMGAVGAQILRFAGWTKSGTIWTKPTTDASLLTLQDRLERITPTWKSGGKLDYSHDDKGLFAEDLAPGTTVEELGRTLESMGLHPQDLDVSSQKALRAMLSWNIPDEPTFDFQRDNIDQGLVLLVFSFDATRFCYNVTDCPQPGPSNELLAATVLNFVQQHLGNQTSKVYVISQWEVAAALQQRCTGTLWKDLTIVPVGTPGEFQNTAEIFGSMLCEWNSLIAEEHSNQHRSDQFSSTLSKALLLSHPDHLRRVFLTAKTIQRSTESPCWMRNILMAPALQPYDLTWPSTLDSTWNLFESVPPTIVHSMGKEITTNWHDKQHLGYFQDGDPQLWTHRRDVWILYDQWAILKGIVTGTIQPNL
ncbi:hypothetical protein ACHAWX_005215 [Stephanocyclus meneghinianus]